MNPSITAKGIIVFRLLSLAGVLAVTVLASLATLLAPAVVHGSPQHAPCTRNAEFARTLHELGENPAHWSVKQHDDYWGAADLGNGTAYITAQVPCHAVADVVRHEAMHLRQGRLYGGLDGALAAIGSRERLEIVADCAAWLLGATRGVYRLEQYEKTGTGCTARDLADARLLVDADES